jgi:hypothetical protein
MQGPRLRPRPATAAGLGVLFALLALRLSACGGESPTEALPVRDPYFDCHGDGCRVLFLYVSNQSFAVPEVHISVLIDGKQALSEAFEVRDQHHHVLFPISVAKGAHTLTARAEGHNLEADFEFSLEDPPRWGVLNFWFEGRPSFNFHDSEYRAGFD